MDLTKIIDTLLTAIDLKNWNMVTEAVQVLHELQENLLEDVDFDPDFSYYDEDEDDY